MMKKLFLLGTALCVATSVWAFGGVGIFGHKSHHSSGVNSIGVHVNGKGKANMDIRTCDSETEELVGTECCLKTLVYDDGGVTKCCSTEGYEVKDGNCQKICETGLVPVGDECKDLCENVEPAECNVCDWHTGTDTPDTDADGELCNGNQGRCNNGTCEPIVCGICTELNTSTGNCDAKECGANMYCDDDAESETKNTCVCNDEGSELYCYNRDEDGNCTSWGCCSGTVFTNTTTADICRSCPSGQAPYCRMSDISGNCTQSNCCRYNLFCVDKEEHENCNQSICCATTSAYCEERNDDGICTTPACVDNSTLIYRGVGFNGADLFCSSGNGWCCAQYDDKHDCVFGICVEEFECLDCPEDSPGYSNSSGECCEPGTVLIREGNTYTHCCPAGSTGYGWYEGDCCRAGTTPVKNSDGTRCCPEGSTDWNEDDGCI